MEVRRVTGGDTGLAVVLTLAGVLSILAQVRVTLWSKTRWRPPQAVAIGVALIGLAFIPVLLASGRLPVSAGAIQVVTGQVVTGDGVVATLAGESGRLLVLAVNLAPLTLTCCLIAVAEMLAMPYIQSTITTFGGGRLVGTYLGMYYLVQGVGAALGQAGTGATFDLADRAGAPWLPWLAMLLVGLASALAVAILDRRGLLAPPPQVPAHA